MRLTVCCVVACIVIISNAILIYIDTEDEVNYRYLLAANTIGIFTFICLMFISE